MSDFDIISKDPEFHKQNLLFHFSIRCHGVPMPMLPWKKTRQESPFTRCRLWLGCGAFLAITMIASSGFQAKEAETASKPRASLPKTVPGPTDNPTTPEKVALGKQLFFDPRLSGDNKMSCATCHRPDKAFGDGLPQAKGAAGRTLKRNTPSLLNVGYYSSFFWDGRAKSLEELALIPIQSATEMNQDLDELEKELNAIPGYVKQFQAVFETKVTPAGIAKALAAFQRTLVIGPSPYDRYLAGNKQALSEEAKRGMDLFFGAAGCARCHRAPLLTDHKFYRLGVSEDRGRGLITGKKEDDYRIRTPSLRNVARTAPYMHDGSQQTLRDVVTFYYRNAPTSRADGLPLDIEPLLGNSFSEISSVVAFLEALTGEEPGIARPELP